MENINFNQILTEAIEKPGKLLEAYKAFYNYSLGNRILATIQCREMGLEITPIATFNQWKEKGRFVKKGSKGISLCMPITIKEKESEEHKTIFVYKKNWFVLNQTDGIEYQPEAVNINWNKEKALTTLNIKEVNYNSVNGNIQGYATKREIAINPLAQFPLKTLFHELAHIVLGHTEKINLADNKDLTKNLIEAEAETVSLLCLESLGLEGSEYCRGYIQAWLNGNKIPEKSAQKIITVADKILKAGV